ncbi:MAG: RNA polymerase sigma factor [Steroidobacteraceae bacterium]
MPADCPAASPVGALLDDGLVPAAQRGDRGAFAALVRAHQRTVYSLALRALGTVGEAEELAQDVFLQLYRDLGRIESSAHLAAWLRRTTFHRIIDSLRRRRRSPATEILDEESAVEALALRSETEPLDGPAGLGDPLLAHRLAALLSQLAPVPRLVLLLRFQEDLDPSDIARELGLPVNTVKSHLKRSLERLRTWYQEPQSHD